MFCPFCPVTTLTYCGLFWWQATSGDIELVGIKFVLVLGINIIISLSYQ
jgi:hypothetical protein